MYGTLNTPRRISTNKLERVIFDTVCCKLHSKLKQKFIVKPLTRTQILWAAHDTEFPGGGLPYETDGDARRKF